MRLRVLDQLHISSIQPDTMRAGQEFEISDDQANQLLARKPAVVEKADASHPNKAQRAPANKAAKSRKGPDVPS